MGKVSTRKARSSGTVVKRLVENAPLSPMAEKAIEQIAAAFAKQIDEEVFARKYAPVKAVLKLVGAGAFLAASIVAPNLPRTLKPFRSDPDEYHAWKRFNIPYLKRSLQRLERQKFVVIKEINNQQVVEMTDRGKRKILHCAIDELAIKKPKHWDGTWRLVSYDIPGTQTRVRVVFREYLCAWGFYPLHESALLHAYSCEQEVEYLKEYLGIGPYVRIFTVTKIENDEPFREFFGIAS